MKYSYKIEQEASKEFVEHSKTHHSSLFCKLKYSSLHKLNKEIPAFISMYCQIPFLNLLLKYGKATV